MTRIQKKYNVYYEIVASNNFFAKITQLIKNRKKIRKNLVHLRLTINNNNNKTLAISEFKMLQLNLVVDFSVFCTVSD